MRHLLKIREVKMEITYQNTKKDIDARIDFLLKETEEGKRIGKKGFFAQQLGVFIIVALFCSFFWGLSGEFTF